MNNCYCFYIDSESRTEIETKLRQTGSQILTSQWPCWMQYYYQGIFPKGSTITVAEFPLFSVVSVADENLFVMTEVEEPLCVNENLTVPMAVCDVSQVDSVSIFDKIKVFNLKNKKVKRITFDFVIFKLGENVKVYLTDNLVIFETPQIPAFVLPDFVSAGMDIDDSTRFMRNMDEKLGFKRPFIHRTTNEQIAYWIYSYSKLRDGVTIPPIHRAEEPVSFNECLFAKNYRL